MSQVKTAAFSQCSTLCECRESRSFAAAPLSLIWMTGGRESADRAVRSIGAPYLCAVFVSSGRNGGRPPRSSPWRARRSRWSCRSSARPNREQEVLGLETCLLDRCLQGVPGRQGDLELNLALRLALHDDGADRHLIAKTCVANLQGDEIAASELALGRTRKLPVATFGLWPCGADRLLPTNGRYQRGCRPSDCDQRAATTQLR